MLRKGMSGSKRKRNPSANAGRPVSKRRLAPVAKSLSTRNAAPVYGRGNGGAFRISHREYIADVTASSVAGAFAVSSYSINPGLAALFPWLSNIAPNFESYKFFDLKFEYEPQCPSSSAGRVEMAVDYDASDSSPLSKAELMSNVHAVPAAVWDAAKYIVDQKDAETLGRRRYVRTGSAPSGTDLRAYDLGNFLVATSGAAASLVAGEIYVSYTVELYTPQSDVSGMASGVSAKISSGAGVDKTHAFGTGSGVISGSLPVTASVNTLTFNKIGEYILEEVVVGTGASSANPTGTLTGGTAVDLDYASNVGDTKLMYSQRVRITAVGATIVFNLSGATTVTAFTIRVAPYAYASS